jgi:hypothetical protein
VWRARCEASTAFGRGRRFPAGVVLRNGDRCLWCPVTTGGPSGSSRCVIPVGLGNEVVGLLRRKRSQVRNGASSYLHRVHLRILRVCGDLFRGRECLSIERKDLEGEQSPWKDRVHPGWQRSESRPDSTAEQRLEVDAPRVRSPEAPRWQRREADGSSLSAANGKGATATVTWCGCWRGFLRGV